MSAARKGKCTINRSESKYFNTAARMDEAFLALLEEKEFAYITVKEICARSGVSRSTFYLHYETMDDLLTESVEYMHARFLARFEQVEGVTQRLTDAPTEELRLLTPDYLCPYLEFIRENRTLYRAAIDHPTIFRTEEAYERMFRHIFDGILDRFAVPEGERHYRMKFYLSGIEAIVEEWLRCGCTDSVERMIGVIRRCAEGS